MIHTEKPTVLDQILSYSPIPLLGERATYKIAISKIQDLEEITGKESSNFSRFCGIFFDMGIRRGFAYGIPALIFLHSCQNEVHSVLRYLLK